MKEENKFKLEELYKPAQETQEFIFDIYTKLIKWRALRDSPYKQFGQRVCRDYWLDSRQKFWGFLPVSFDNDTPQFFFPETRNQVIGILSKIANLKIKPSFEGVEGMDMVKATLLKDLFEYWRRGSNRKISNFWQFFYTVVNGTAVVFTAYNNKKRKVKNITMHDPETGKTSWNEVELDESDVEDQIVNLEDLFIPKIWEPDIQKQGEVIWRVLMKTADFRDIYKKYPNQQYVMPGSQFADSSIFQDFLSYDVRGADFIEVIKYFNSYKDQYAIIANGVMLNPMVDAHGNEDIAPLPWNHKRLPFSKTIFEPIEPNFFYGMPLPQKVKTPQEALNRMWELYIDRESRSVAAPILTNDPSMEFGLEYKAGRFYQVQGDPTSQYRELNVKPSSPSFQNMLASLTGIIQRTGSGGTTSSPTSRQPKSATENSIMQQEKTEAQGLYFLFYQDLLEQKTWLTLKNMIQFYTAGKTEKVVGERKFKKIISLTETRLFGGGIGNHEIRITDTPVSADLLRQEAYMRSLTNKERVEIIEVTPQSLYDLNFDIKINFEVENSPASEWAMYLDFIITLKNLFGQSGLLSDKKILYRLTEKFNEQISDFTEDNVSQDYENDRFGLGNPKPQGENPLNPNSQGGNPLNPNSQGGNPLNPNSLPAVSDANQMARGMQFGAKGPMGAQNMPTITQKF